jgi:CheY-like chemotaxis protein/HPt (histidine-containing phosphotransfer) domain-containing protein
MHLHKPVRKSQLHDALLTLMGQLASTRTTAESSQVAAAPELRGRILLVEDNETGRQIGLNMLQRLGLDVELANNGREAVAATETTPFDAVLMDCQMPEMDGFEATRAIRQREKLAKNGRSTPIIALTANAMKGDREACLQAGMNDYLAKPLSINTLMTTLKRWLGETPVHSDDSSSFSASGETPTVGSANEDQANEDQANEDQANEDQANEDQANEDQANEDQGSDEIRINLDQLQEMRDLLGSELGLLVDTFEELGRTVATQLRSAVEASDLEGLTAAAHKLKGSCGNLGAEQLMELCRQLEESSRRGDASDARKQVERIVAMHQATCRALHRLIETL